jgi:hypothetical protein
MDGWAVLLPFGIFLVARAIGRAEGKKEAVTVIAGAAEMFAADAAAQPELKAEDCLLALARATRRRAEEW